MLTLRNEGAGPAAGSAIFETVEFCCLLDHPLAPSLQPDPHPDFHLPAMLALWQHLRAC